VYYHIHKFHCSLGLVRKSTVLMKDEISCQIQVSVLSFRNELVGSDILVILYSDCTSFWNLAPFSVSPNCHWLWISRLPLFGLSFHFGDYIETSRSHLWLLFDSEPYEFSMWHVRKEWHVTMQTFFFVLSSIQETHFVFTFEICKSLLIMWMFWAVHQVYTPTYIIKCNLVCHP